MKTNLHVGFPGTCREAVEFYETVSHTSRMIPITYGEAPGGSPVPEESNDLVMHTALQVGNVVLMGADAPPGHSEPTGGFHVCIETADEAELKRLFAALSEGGSVTMPLSPTFWSPLFAMFKDRYGVGWMLSMPGQQG